MRNFFQQIETLTIAFRTSNFTIPFINYDKITFDPLFKIF